MIDIKDLLQLPQSSLQSDCEQDGQGQFLSFEEIINDRIVQQQLLTSLVPSIKLSASSISSYGLFPRENLLLFHTVPMLLFYISYLRSRMLVRVMTTYPHYEIGNFRHTSVPKLECVTHCKFNGFCRLCSTYNLADFHSLYFYPRLVYSTGFTSSFRRRHIVFQIEIEASLTIMTHSFKTYLLFDLLLMEKTYET